MHHQFKLVASLVCFAFVANALPSHPNHNDALEKRASYDLDFDFDSEHPPAPQYEYNDDSPGPSDFDVYEDANAEPVDPWDEIYFTKKAASASTPDSFNKWLNRAQGYLTSDPKITVPILARYQDKYHSAHDEKAIQSTWKKVEYWSEKAAFEKNTAMLNYIMNAGPRYEQEARTLLDYHVKLQRVGTLAEMQDAHDKYYEALRVKYDWESKKTTSKKALANCEKEIVKFNQAWAKENLDGNNKRYLEEMRSHAINAIAWKIKSKELRK